MPSINPLKVDPTRTSALRRQLMMLVRRMYAKVSRAVTALVEGQDVFGLKPYERVTTNRDWQFKTSPQKVEEFLQWLRDQAVGELKNATAKELWRQFVRTGYLRGAARAFTDAGKGKDTEAFLRGSFGNPVSVEKVQLLVSRVFTDLDGINEQMAQNLTRVLADGLVTGASPIEIARDMRKKIDLTKGRAETIARTEIIRAHAEGQLDAFDAMGIEEVGVAVEWATARDGRVCPLCAPLKGMVLKVSEARGLLPRHPRCRCAWLPWLGEKGKENKTTKPRIVSAIRKSDKAGGESDDWAEGITISKTRPDFDLNEMGCSGPKTEYACGCSPEEEMFMRDFGQKDGPIGDRSVVLHQAPVPVPFHVPVLAPLDPSMATLDTFLLNANPAGCNQHSGPGCSPGGAAAVSEMANQATDHLTKQFLNDALFNWDKKSEKDLASQLASMWRGANHLGHDKVKAVLEEAMSHVGAKFHGPGAGTTTPYLGRYYESIAGVFSGDRVKVIRQPIVYSDESTLVKGRITRNEEPTDNSNPAGCNQFTGPGCAVGQGAKPPNHNPKTYGELLAGDTYKNSLGKVKEIEHIEPHPTDAGKVNVKFKGESGVAVIDKQVPIPGGGITNKPVATKPTNDDIFGALPPVSPPPTKVHAADNPDSNKPTSKNDLATASGLVGHLKSSGASFTELDLQKIASLNPNGIVNGTFKAPTIPVGAENKKQLEKLSKVLPEGTVIKGKYVTKKDVTPEAIAAVAGSGATVTKVTPASSLPTPKAEPAPVPGPLPPHLSSKVGDGAAPTLGNQSKLKTEKAKEAVAKIEAEIHKGNGSVLSSELAAHVTGMNHEELGEVKSYFGVHGSVTGFSLKDAAVEKYNQKVKTVVDAEAFAKLPVDKLKVIHGSPSYHSMTEGYYDKASPVFKAENPHIPKLQEKDKNVDGVPNPLLPDHARPPVGDYATAAHINNYTWGYDSGMNKALYETGQPPPGKFGGGGKKPHVDGPEMYKNLQKQFAAAKTFGPPPIAVNRGITVSQEAQQRLEAAARKALETGVTATMPGFQSTSTGSGFGGNVKFKINAIHGLDVRPYSHYPSPEDELLLNHNSGFKVTKVERSASGTNLIIHMDQVHPGLSKPTGIELTGKAGNIAKGI